MYVAAMNAGVLERELLKQVKPFLTSIKPRKAVFDHNYVKKIDGPNVKKGKNKMDLAEQLRADIRDFKKTSGATRLVTVWCGSTEVFLQPSEIHQTVKAFEHRPLDDLCLRVAHGGRAIRQRRSQLDGGHSRHA
jgi:myo-inositol-1-phosphate synthase